MDFSGSAFFGRTVQNIREMKENLLRKSYNTGYELERTFSIMLSLYSEDRYRLL